MVEEKNRARFERARRERESRDRAISIRKRYVERKDYSGSELISNIPAASRDVRRSAGRFMQLLLSGRAMP
jgi:hypothetical protein